MRKIYIETIFGASSARMKKCLNSDSNRDPPAFAADCSAERLIALLSSAELSSLAALVWGLDHGGPVEEAEKDEVASVWQTRS